MVNNNMVNKKEKFFDDEDSLDAFLLFIFLLICFLIIWGIWFYLTPARRNDVKLGEIRNIGLIMFNFIKYVK